MKDFDAIKQDALDFLRNNMVAVLATSVDNTPHAADVYYDIDDEFNFYFVTKPNTHKSVHIAENPKVALVVGTGPRKISVQVQGRAELVLGEDRSSNMERLAEKLEEHGIEDLPAEIIKDLKNQKFLLYKVIPNALEFLNIDDTDYSSSISNKLHQII